jgi:hypothetical protein
MMMVLVVLVWLEGQWIHLKRYSARLVHLVFNLLNASVFHDAPCLQWCGACASCRSNPIE